MADSWFDRDRDFPGARRGRTLAIGGGWAGGSGSQGGGSLHGFGGRDADDWRAYDMHDRDPIDEEEWMDDHRRHAAGPDPRGPGRPYRGPDYGHGGSGRRFGAPRGPAPGEGAREAYADQGGRMEGGRYRAHDAERGQAVGRRGENYGRSGPEGGGAHDYEPDYLDWRRARINEMDESYEAWRRERQSRFGEDFEKWRATRAVSGGGESGGSTGG